MFFFACCKILYIDVRSVIYEHGAVHAEVLLDAEHSVAVGLCYGRCAVRMRSRDVDSSVATGSLVYIAPASLVICLCKLCNFFASLLQVLLLRRLGCSLLPARALFLSQVAWSYGTDLRTSMSGVLPRAAGLSSPGALGSLQTFAIQRASSSTTTTSTGATTSRSQTKVEVGVCCDFRKKIPQTGMWKFGRSKKDCRTQCGHMQEVNLQTVFGLQPSTITRSLKDEEQKVQRKMRRKEKFKEEKKRKKV